jgi:aspartyl-tRNA synthetase
MGTDTSVDGNLLRRIQSLRSLPGWGSAWDHGGVILLTLGIRGLVQLVFNPEYSRDAHANAHVLRPEWVLAAKGIVRRRPDESLNPDMPTGSIEIFVDEVKILNRSEPPPFPLDDDTDPTDAVRYKYLPWLRRRTEQSVDPARFMSIVRDFLNEISRH